jgi:hypothetical protein
MLPSPAEPAIGAVEIYPHRLRAVVFPRLPIASGGQAARERWPIIHLPRVCWRSRG